MVPGSSEAASPLPRYRQVFKYHCLLQTLPLRGVSTLKGGFWLQNGRVIKTWRAAVEGTAPGWAAPAQRCPWRPSKGQATSRPPAVERLSPPLWLCGPDLGTDGYYLISAARRRGNGPRQVKTHVQAFRLAVSPGQSGFRGQVLGHSSRPRGVGGKVGWAISKGCSGGSVTCTGGSQVSKAQLRPWLRARCLSTRPPGWRPCSVTHQAL